LALFRGCGETTGKRRMSEDPHPPPPPQTSSPTISIAVEYGSHLLDVIHRVCLVVLAELNYLDKDMVLYIGQRDLCGLIAVFFTCGAQPPPNRKMDPLILTV